MRNRALRPFVTVLSLLLAACTTAQAGPVSITEVVQVIGSYKNIAQVPGLRFRAITTSRPSDDPHSPNSNSGSHVDTQITDIVNSSLSTAPASPDSLLSGMEIKSDDTPSQIDVINQGDLEGSICDCGEIPVVEHHHMHWWPLIFLAAIPFFFIHHHNECTTCPLVTPTPTPTPPPD